MHTDTKTGETTAQAYLRTKVMSASPA